MAVIYQRLRTQIDLFLPTRYIYRTEIKPGKHPDTRIKSLPLTNGHGRYPHITVTPKRVLFSAVEWPLHTYNRYKFIAVSLLKSPIKPNRAI